MISLDERDPGVSTGYPQRENKFAACDLVRRDATQFLCVARTRANERRWNGTAVLLKIWRSLTKSVPPPFKIFLSQAICGLRCLEKIAVKNTGPKSWPRLASGVRWGVPDFRVLQSAVNDQFYQSIWPLTSATNSTAKSKVPQRFNIEIYFSHDRETQITAKIVTPIFNAGVVLELLYQGLQMFYVVDVKDEIESLVNIRSIQTVSAKFVHRARTYLF